MPIELGLKGHAECLVTPELTAAAVGSGSLEVFSTPSMIALIEKAALTSLLPFLEPGQSTVGTRLDVAHSAATPLGMTVWAESEVTEVERRRVVFAVLAYDEAGLIGEGTHERFLVDAEKFMAKCAAKTAPKN